MNDTKMAVASAKEQAVVLHDSTDDYDIYYVAPINVLHEILQKANKKDAKAYFFINRDTGKAEYACSTVLEMDGIKRGLELARSMNTENTEVDATTNRH